MPVVNPEKTGENIKKYIKANGLTVKNVQNELGLATANAVYKWLNGYTLPTLDNLVVLAGLLGVKIDDLIVVERV